MASERFHCEHFNKDVTHVYVGRSLNGDMACSCGGKFVPVGDTFQSNDNSYYYGGKGDVKATTNPTVKKRSEAYGAYSLAFEAYQRARLAYRARTISDEQFLAARRACDEAEAKLDQAELAAHNEPARRKVGRWD